MSANSETVSALVNDGQRRPGADAMQLRRILLQPIVGDRDRDEQQPDQRAGDAGGGHEQIVEIVRNHAR